MAALLCGCGGVNATRTQPNILLVVIDTVRADTDFTTLAHDLIERDREILDRLAE